MFNEQEFQNLMKNEDPNLKFCRLNLCILISKN